MSIEISSMKKMIDNSLLSPDATRDEVRRFCEESVKYGLKSVFVLPSYVTLARDILDNSETVVGAPVGFPLGGNTIEVKMHEAEDNIKNGAQELDMLVNIGYLKSRDFNYINREIEKFVRTVKGHDQELVTKVIIETGLLSDEEKVQVSRIIKEAGADYIKTCTGYNVGKATVHDIRLIRKAVGEDMGIKASGGGVATYADAEVFIEAGASRIGTKFGIDIIETCNKNP